jgi:hypothetical protein
MILKGEVTTHQRHLCYLNLNCWVAFASAHGCKMQGIASKQGESQETYGNKFSLKPFLNHLHSRTMEVAGTINTATASQNIKHFWK